MTMFGDETSKLERLIFGEVSKGAGNLESGTV
jgi:hypothetical protein